MRLKSIWTFWFLMLVNILIHAASTVQFSIPSLQVLKQAKFLGRMPLHQKIHLTVWLKLNNSDQVLEKINALYDPKSPDFQRFLTVEAFNKQFAPIHAIDVRNYFVSQGFVVKQKNRLSLEIIGEVGQFEKLFHSTFNRYQYKNQERFSATQPTQLAEEIRPYVADITGFSNFPRFKPMYIKNKANYVPTDGSLNGFTGAQLQTAYRTSSISYQETILDGSGQTIVLMDGCTGATPNQLIESANTFIGDTSSLQPKLTYGENFVIVVHGEVLSDSLLDEPLCEVDSGWGVEISLDMQGSHTIAPGAKTVLVIDDNLDVGTVIDSICSSPTHSIAGFDQANVISNSWGAVETSGYFPNFELAFQEAALSGLSLNFSTGDCGDDTNPQNYCGNPPFPSATESPAVNYPASSGLVTAVGGTSLFVDDQWNYAFETGWGNTELFHDTSYTNQFFAGSGGGVSQIFSMPPWQAETMRGFSAGGYNQPLGTYRALPDIALLADNVTGLLIYNTFDCDGVDGACGSIGGTSLSSPLFSGVLTLINQARALQSRKTIGLAAPYLYWMNESLAINHAINVIIPPHLNVPNAVPATNFGLSEIPPASSFALFVSKTERYSIFSWDSSLTIEPSDQPWNDVVGVGSPNIPNFVLQMVGFG